MNLKAPSCKSGSRSSRRYSSEAIALLPSLAQHHTFNTKAIAAGIQRAHVLIGQIEALLAPDP